MSRDPHVQALMVDLIRAIKVSLAAGDAARALVAELLKRGAGTGSLLLDDSESPTATLTPQDRKFLSALAIRPADR
ncbi:MAG: hypothetical protein HY726_12990 [Candidatus Rokubacteria bacterium]|nr:hypothetical protein [Candidatus Rokubacteria bacterium]